MQLSFFQLLVIRPLVRSILGALGLLTSEEQIDSFLGSVVRHFLTGQREAVGQIGGGLPLKAWNILNQMDVDVGLSDVKAQAVIQAVFDIELSEEDANLVVGHVRAGDHNQFIQLINGYDRVY